MIDLNRTEQRAEDRRGEEPAGLVILMLFPFVIAFAVMIEVML